MGSGTHSSDFDMFPGTHGTHANGATAIVTNKCKSILLLQSSEVRFLSICHPYHHLVPNNIMGESCY